MDERITIVTAPDIDASTLFGLYLLIPGNQNLMRDDFVKFLSTGSVDRQLFLGEHCDYQFIDKGSVVLLSYKLKQ